MEGDQAAVLSHISAATAAGAAIEADVCNYFQIEDGQIASMGELPRYVALRTPFPRRVVLELR